MEKKTSFSDTVRGAMLLSGSSGKAIGLVGAGCFAMSCSNVDSF